MDALEEVAHSRERLDAREVFIGAFADLGAELGLGKAFAEVPKGAVPRFDVEVVGIDMGLVEIEEEGSDGLRCGLHSREVWQESGGCQRGSDGRPNWRIAGGSTTE
ncbi:MAG: hypothetical protein ABIR38_09210 [Chthoniobacterales bacterium]